MEVSLLLVFYCSWYCGGQAPNVAGYWIVVLLWKDAQWRYRMYEILHAGKRSR